MATIYSHGLCKAILQGCQRQLYMDGILLLGHGGLQGHRRERVEDEKRRTQKLVEMKFLCNEEEDVDKDASQPPLRSHKTPQLGCLRNWSSASGQV